MPQHSEGNPLRGLGFRVGTSHAIGWLDREMVVS